jgi:hypothetical protein
MSDLRAFVVAVALASCGCAAGIEDGGTAEGDTPADSSVPVPEASADNATHDAQHDAVGAGTDDASDDDASDDDASDGAPKNDDARPEDADNDAGGDDAGAGDTSTPDAAPIDLAPLGQGYTWQSMTSATATSGRQSAPAVNDGSLTTQANIDSSSGDSANAWEAAGVLFTSARTVTSVRFVQGTTVSGGDGWFEASFGLQLSMDGTTWTASSWTSTPAYSYTSAVSGKTYTFTGAPATGIKGVRVVGQVNTVGDSWWAAVKEIVIYGQ